MPFQKTRLLDLGGAGYLNFIIQRVPDGEGWFRWGFATQQDGHHGYGRLPGTHFQARHIGNGIAKNWITVKGDAKIPRSYR